MRLFQYEREDLSVSIISAENKEEACDLLFEFDDNVNIENLIPLKNFMINLYPVIKNKNVCWEIDNIGINTLLELPLLEELPKEDYDNNVFYLQPLKT